jgi:CubicO group peptidase (beta-lactamase class C family)
MEFARTRRRVEYELYEDEFTRGIQMVVEVSGRRVLARAEGDDGTGRPLSTTTVLRVYCTLKPILAVAIARLVDMGAIDLDAPLERRWGDVRAVAGGVTPRHLLTHTAGVHTCSGLEIEMLTPVRRRRRIDGIVRPAGWRLGADAGYSEAAAWHLLGWLVEEVTGDDLRAHLREHVLDPLGMTSTWIGMTPDEYRAALPGIGINVDMRARGGFPLLYERSERVCCTTNAAFGGYSTADDLARFYTTLLERNRAAISSLASPQVLLTFCSTVRPPVYDQVLDRVCPYGLGFMTSLNDHAFGTDCSPASFGHSGYAGASFAFADPAHELAVGVIFNGVVGHESAFLRRRALTRALYADLEEELPRARQNPGRQTRRVWKLRKRAD